MPFRGDELVGWFRPLSKYRDQPELYRYGLAVGTVAVATLARMAVEHRVGGTVPFITFYPALLVCTFLGGLGPGVVSLLLSALAADFFFIAPTYTISFPILAPTIVLFLIIGGAMVGIIHLLNTALDHLADQESNVRSILETAPVCEIAVDNSGVITMVNAATERLFGYDRAELIGKGVEVLIPSRLRAEHVNHRRAYMRNPTAGLMSKGRELWGLTKDGAEVPVEVTLNPIIRGNRRAGVLASVIDLSERRSAHLRQQVLVREVHHRSRNLLATVQAIARGTIRDDRPSKEGRELFLGKLQALSRTHELFFSAEGAALGEIVQGELAAFSDQAVIDGTHFVLSPTAAQNFTLIVHELTTNALKYGALSASSGKVSVTLKVEAGQFYFDWAEEDGPQVSPPIRTGFGKVILEDVARGFGAEVTTEYAEAGFHYRLRVPSASIRAAASFADGHDTAPRFNGATADRRFQ